MPEIGSYDDLRGWLKGKPAGWSAAIACRSALRALPYATRARTKQGLSRTFLLATVRGEAVSWSAGKYPDHNMNVAAASAAHAHSYGDSDTFSVATIAAAQAAEYAAAAAARAAYAERAASSSVYAERAASSSAYASRAAAASARAAPAAPVWRNVRNDCEWLERHAGAPGAARRVLVRPLWPADPPDGWDEQWLSCREALVAIDLGYGVWIDWFEHRINGEEAGFAILGDIGNREDEAIAAKLFAATDEDFWSKGAAYVNATLQQWLDEARARAAANLSGPNRELDRDAIAASLQQMASPQARITDGKLDAGPNVTFDQPLFSGDLTDLPAELLAFLRVLSRSLPPNASRFMHESLAGYQDELLVRGNRPILGILKALASAIARELWSRQSMLESDDPADWAMQDEREWETGMADLFRTFFHYHGHLIAHYPLDEEREEFLRSVPIDEDAATGDTLNNPVKTVLEALIVLHGQGMATDDLIRIAEALARFTQNIASLPPPVGGLPDEVVTPKRRHVLMTAGFYLHLYSVLGSTASIAPFASELLVRLQLRRKRCWP